MNESSAPSNDALQNELSRRLFHLQTLYDASRELLGLSEMEAILRTFLLTALGSFGVVRGLVFMTQINTPHEEQLICAGIPENERDRLKKVCNRLLVKHDRAEHFHDLSKKDFAAVMPSFVAYVSIFKVAHDCTGVFALGGKIVEERYSDSDRHLLETLVNNLVVALKNARSAQALREAYHEVSSLNRAKDKLINHLSHELRTPISLLKTALRLLQRPLSSLPAETWQRSYERAQRSLDRLSEIQGGAEDIVLKKAYRQYPMVSKLLEQCADVLEATAAEQTGNADLVQKLRRRIDAIYHIEEKVPERIDLAGFVGEKMNELRPVFDRRGLQVSYQNSERPLIFLPQVILDNVFNALIKNAVENTPDQGRIDVSVRFNRKDARLTVHDYGIGVAEEHRVRIFEGFYPTQDVSAYATKTPFSFNAGGKGSDLLRAKIFSERYGFTIGMSSSRCSNMPQTGDQCPGRISECIPCRRAEDCHTSGFTRFDVIFPAVDS